MHHLADALVEDAEELARIPRREVVSLDELARGCLHGSASCLVGDLLLCSCVGDSVDELADVTRELHIEGDVEAVLGYVEYGGDGFADQGFGR